MSQEIKTVYVGVQAFSVTGDPMDDAILDAIVERLELIQAMLQFMKKIILFMSSYTPLI